MDEDILQDIRQLVGELKQQVAEETAFNLEMVRLLNQQITDLLEAMIDYSARYGETELSARAMHTVMKTNLEMMMLFIRR